MQGGWHMCQTVLLHSWFLFTFLWSVCLRGYMYTFFFSGTSYPTAVRLGAQGCKEGNVATRGYHCSRDNSPIWFLYTLTGISLSFSWVLFDFNAECAHCWSLWIPKAKTNYSKGTWIGNGSKGTKNEVGNVLLHCQFSVRNFLFIYFITCLGPSKGQK